MIESPIQILRERIVETVTKLFDALRKPSNWLKYFFKQSKK